MVRLWHCCSVAPGLRRKPHCDASELGFQREQRGIPGDCLDVIQRIAVDRDVAYAEGEGGVLDTGADLIVGLLICPLLSGPISILELVTKEEWNGEEAQAGRDHRQAA